MEKFDINIVRLSFLGHVAFRGGEAYRGGILITDANGRPVEFRSTTPIKPNALQRTLYGSSMMTHIATELLGIPLLKSLQEKPSVILIREEVFFGVRLHVETPWRAMGKALASLRRMDSAKLPAAYSKELIKFINSKEFKKFITEQPSKKQEDEAFQKYVNILAERGWFISLEHTPLAGLRRIAKCYEGGKIEAADDAMSVHFSECLDEIEDSLTKAFPSRKTILRKAFEAHRNKNYELSIPAMLSQADGIGCEISNGLSVYSRKKNNVRKLKRFLETEARKERSPAYWALVAEVLPVNASHRDRSRFRDAMNRNSILHGEDVSYATSVNAHKAVSWIQYVAAFKTSRWLDGEDLFVSP